MYQLAVEFSTLDLPKSDQSWGDYYWECLLDAKLKFKNSEEENPTIVHSIFSRVYIDLDPVSTAEEENSFEQEQEPKEEMNESEQNTDELENFMDPLKEILNEETGQEEKLSELNKLKEEVNEEEGPKVEKDEKKKTKEELDAEKRARRCKNFGEKIKKFKFSSRSESEEQRKDDNSGLVDVKDYKCYPSVFSDYVWQLKKANKKKKKKCPFSPNQFVNPPHRGDKDPATPTTSTETVEEEDEKLPTELMSHFFAEEPMSVEEKIHFDFAYKPDRDRQLVAKNAKDYLLKDKTMRKYWSQRYNFFSKMDDGILMDRESWFSVTPEGIAQHIADRLVRVHDCTIMDAFTGAGGNAIQFAHRGAFVYAVDIDPMKLRCASKNAEIYGVSSRINFICGDYFHIVKAMQGAREAKERIGIASNGADPYPYGIDVVYLSPPWGGPSYGKTEFDICKDMDLNGFEIFRKAKMISPNIVYFLPKTTSINQLVTLAAPDGAVETEQSVLHGKIKALHAYYGRLVAKD